jgi:hypothetical protein
MISILRDQVIMEGSSQYMRLIYRIIFYWLYNIDFIMNARRGFMETPYPPIFYHRI